MLSVSERAMDSWPALAACGWQKGRRLTSVLRQREKLSVASCLQVALGFLDYCLGVSDIMGRPRVDDAVFVMCLVCVCAWPLSPISS